MIKSCPFMCSWLLHFLVFQKLLRQSFTIGDAQHRSLLPQRLHPVTVSVLHKFCYVSLKIFMKVLLLWDSFGSGIMKRLAGTHIIAKNSICFCRKQQCGQNKRYVYFLFFWHFFHSCVLSSQAPSHHKNSSNVEAPSSLPLTA